MEDLTETFPINDTPRPNQKTLEIDNPLEFDIQCFFSMLAAHGFVKNKLRDLQFADAKINAAGNLCVTIACKQLTFHVDEDIDFGDADNAPKS